MQRAMAVMPRLVVARSVAALAVLPAAMPLHRAIAPSAAVAGAGCAVPSGARCYSGTPSWVRKARAKSKAQEQRLLLKFAAKFDPVRTARLQLAQTLERLGWAVNVNEQISDGLWVDFAMKESYVCFELVESKHIVPPDHPAASNAPAMVAPPIDAKTGHIVPPHLTPFPKAPASWEDPTLGLVYDAETAARHAVIRSKGWALVAIPQPLWELARTKPQQHYARKDVLLARTLPIAPFEPRPVNVTGASPSSSDSAGGGKGGAGGKGKKAAAGDAADVLAGLDAVTSETSAESRQKSARMGTSNRSRRRASMAADDIAVETAEKQGGPTAFAAVAAPSPAAASASAAAAAAGPVKMSGASTRGGRAAAVDEEEDDAGGVAVPDDFRGDVEDGAAGGKAKGTGKAAGAKAPAAKPRKKESGGFRR